MSVVLISVQIKVFHLITFQKSVPSAVTFRFLNDLIVARCFAAKVVLAKT